MIETSRKKIPVNRFKEKTKEATAPKTHLNTCIYVSKQKLNCILSSKWPSNPFKINNSQTKVQYSHE